MLMKYSYNTYNMALFVFKAVVFIAPRTILVDNYVVVEYEQYDKDMLLNILVGYGGEVGTITGNDVKALGL